MAGRRNYSTKHTRYLESAGVRYNPESVDNAEKAMHDREYGLINARKKWTEAEDVLLVDAMLDRVPISGPGGLISILRRSRHAIQTRYRTMVIRRPGAIFTVALAPTRNNLHWDGPDYYVLDQAYGEGGLDYGANNTKYIANLLRRTPAAVEAKLRALQRATFQGLLYSVSGGRPLDAVARMTAADMCDQIQKR